MNNNNYCYEFLEENAVKWDTIPFRYEWKFGDGTTGAGAVVEHCYPGPGRYLIQLDVINLVTKEVMYNEKTYSLEITDIEQPYITSPDEAVTDQRIRFSAEETNLPGWNIDRYYWNFGDETIAIGKEVDKVYHRPGTYNVQLIVSTEPDPGGVVREACICKNITIFHDRANVIDQCGIARFRDFYTQGVNAGIDPNIGSDIDCNRFIVQRPVNIFAPI